MVNLRNLSDIDQIFKEEFDLYPQGTHNLILNYIVYPTSKQEIQKRQQYLKRIIDSPRLEYRMIVHDIQSYISRIKTRMTEILTIPFHYLDLRDLLDYLASLFTHQFLNYIDLSGMIAENCHYIAPKDRLKLISYLRLV